MSGLRTAGGVLTIIGGSFTLIMVYYRNTFLTYGTTIEKLSWSLMVCVGILGLIGGIFGVNNRRLGGLLALAGGCIYIVVSLFLGDIICYYSLGFFISWSCGVVALESILMLVGGVLILIPQSK